jgi:small subunit ribosomal protein S4
MNYGLTEKQMLRYVRKARRVAGSTGQVLLQLLEMRLDNTVFRMGMAPTIPAARQLVNHGHVTVNGRPVNIASYQCRRCEKQRSF